MRRRWIRLAWVACLLTMGGAQASVAPPLAPDPVLEARVMEIAEELRCLVCQNETLAASQADLAVDLRSQIRGRLKQGESKGQIVDFMVERYGPFVRYRPAFNATTVLLWGGPFGLLAIALLALAAHLRGQRRQGTMPLDEAQRARAAALLQRGGARP